MASKVGPKDRCVKPPSVRMGTDGHGRARMDRTGSVLDVLIPNLQQTPRTVVPYRYLMRKRGGEREQFLPKKLVLRTGVLSHPVYGWVRTGTDGPYELSFGRFDPKSSTNT